MQDHNSHELWHKLHRIELGHWYDVNLNDGKTVHELYTENGRFIVGKQERRGREEIRKFYEARRRRGVRTARHFISNFLLLPGESERHMRAAGMICLHAGDQPPLLPSRPPILIADLVDDFVLEDDGVWRFSSHVLRPVFIGDDPFVRHAVSPES
jgi:hypothetical protein